MVTHDAKRVPTFALLGCGPRGLNVLERFVTRAIRDPGRTPTVLHVIEPADCGPGIHHCDTPDYLLLNTVARQLTAFVDDGMIAGGGIAGPSLYDWAAARDVVFTSNTGEQRAVTATDYLPRRLLGQYLTWATRIILDACPPWLEIRICREAATDVRPGPDGREVVVLASGRVLEADHVTITVGHNGTTPADKPDRGASAGAWLGSPYPLPDAVGDVQPGDVLAVLGSGLTAMDVIAALTVGRGGRYVRNGDDIAYVPSGREPTLVLLSKNGTPARSRPLPYRSDPDSAVYLTTDALQRLREARPGGRLDFRGDVLPLVLAEMQHRIEAAVDDPGRTGAVFARIVAEWDGIVPDSARESAKAYAEWYVRRMADDLVEASNGLDNSPLKFAFEVVRDHRDALRSAVASPGLTSHSARQFFESFVPAVNRNVICPQLERNVELLALIRSGILTLGPGPAPRLRWSGNRWLIESSALARAHTVPADKAIAAFVPAPQVRNSVNPLVRSLHRNGRIRPLVVDGSEFGAEVDATGRPIDAEGRPQPTLALLGPLTEGTRYYNHYVTSPGKQSRATLEADQVVREAIALARQGMLSSDEVDRPILAR